jgi:hypothetical protein
MKEGPNQHDRRALDGQSIVYSPPGTQQPGTQWGFAVVYGRWVGTVRNEPATPHTNNNELVISCVAVMTSSPPHHQRLRRATTPARHVAVFVALSEHPFFGQVALEKMIDPKDQNHGSTEVDWLTYGVGAAFDSFF